MPTLDQIEAMGTRLQGVQSASRKPGDKTGGNPACADEAACAVCGPWCKALGMNNEQINQG